MTTLQRVKFDLSLLGNMFKELLRGANLIASAFQKVLNGYKKVVPFPGKM
jgi:hypothetical protein